MAIAGIAPEVQRCCLTQKAIAPNFSDSRWRVGFSFEGGGLVNLSTRESFSQTASESLTNAAEISLPKIDTKLGACELNILQQLGSQDLPAISELSSEEMAWVKIEHLLRDYSKYHFGRSFRSASLVDALSP